MKWERLIVTVLTICLVFFSLHETYLFLQKTPAGSIYPFVHGYIPDYYYYLSLMQQGAEGKFLLTTRYTSELYQPVAVQTFYAVTGFVAGQFHIWIPTMYFLARIILGGGLLIFGYYLATKMLRDSRQRLLAFLLMIFGVPLWFILDGQLWTQGNFWRGIEPLGRVTFIPHHLAANIFLILAIIATSRLKILPASFFGILAGWTNPASALVFLFATVWLAIRKPYLLPKLMIICVFSVLPLLIFSHYQNSVFPWTEYKRIETLWKYPLDLSTYLKIMSVSGVFAFVAIPIVLKKNHALWDLIVGWFLWPIVGVGILQYLIPMSNARYIQAAYYIPTSILAAVSIARLRKWQAFGVVLLFVLASVPSFYANIRFNEGVVREGILKLAMYPSQELMTSIEWLSTFGKSDDVVVAPGWISTIIPAFSNKRVLLGHPTLTFQSDRKQKDMDMLYAFNDASEVARVIKTHRVSLIWTDETLQVPETFAGYRFTPIYKNSQVTYYQVIPMK